MEYTKEVLEKAKKAVEVCNAILEGKEIEFLIDNNKEWSFIAGPSLNFHKETYRVKPQLKYVPFTFEDAKDLIGKVARTKKYKNLAIINFVGQLDVTLSQSTMSYLELFNEYTFLDGTPCGKLENQ